MMTLRSRQEIPCAHTPERCTPLERERGRAVARFAVTVACALTLACGGADSLRPAQNPGPGTTDSTRVRLRGPFATIAACTPPTAPADATLSVTPDVDYSGDAQRMDIVAPAGASRRPMVLLIHGGGWRHGQRNDDSLRFTARVLAGEGFIAATVSYRLTEVGPMNQFPAGVADVRCAVRWLRSNAARFGGDPARIAVAGLSAGGHLASMLGTGSDMSRLDDASCPISSSVSPAVQAVISYYAPSELVSCAAETVTCLLATTDFLGVAPSANVALASVASPMTYVDASDPPFLFVHGLKDDAIAPRQSRILRDALTAAGVATGYVEVPSGGHGFPILGASPSVLGDSTQLAETCTALAFLRAALGAT